jgi:hypothetical protein
MPITLDPATGSRSAQVPMVSTGTSTISGSVTGGAGLIGPSTTVYVDRGDTSVTLDETSGTDFVHPVPEAAGLFAVDAQGATQSGSFSVAVRRGLLAGATGVQLELMPVVDLQSPADGGTLAPGAPFVWTGPAPGVYLVLVVPDSTGQPGLQVLTTRQQVTMPDLSALGFSLPTGSTAQWLVFEYGNISSVDQTAAGEHTLWLPFRELPPTDGFLTATSSHHFTVGP